MNAKLCAICSVVALLLVGAGGATAAGFDAVPGPDRGPNGGAGPADTPTSGPSNATEPAQAAAEPAFTVVADSVEECGATCRDVTSTVTNERNATAADVSVSTRIYAGREASGDPVWQGSERVGTLAAGGSHSATERIELSVFDAISVKRANGWVTIVTTVESADRTETLTERRQVA